MSKKMILKRVDNPEGHQVCQVDQINKTVAIRNKNYLTTQGGEASRTPKSRLMASSAGE